MITLVKSDSRAWFFSDDLSSSFVRNEIALLAENFGKVEIVTGNAKFKPLAHNNITVHCITDKDYTTFGTLKRNFTRFTKIALTELTFFPWYFLRPFIFMNVLSSLLRCFYKVEVLKNNVFKTVNKQEADLFYSFWFNDWATTLSLLKFNGSISAFYSRAHGTDLYEERVPILKKIPLRRFQMEHVTSVFSVSRAGTEYLKNKYPGYKNKIETSYLGTSGSSVNKLNAEAYFTLVSCATIRNIKRIHLIPEILMNVNIPVKWFHIGGKNEDDPTLPVLKENLEKLVKTKPGVEVQFIGELSNKEVMDFYASNSVNLFLSVSETEGLPVSMMEAISAGIPVMATNVGGCHEIVNQRTGILIPKDFEPALVAEKIIQFSSSEKNTEVFRKGVIQFWRENFEAGKNFQTFIEFINRKLEIVK